MEKINDENKQGNISLLLDEANKCFCKSLFSNRTESENRKFSFQSSSQAHIVESKIKDFSFIPVLQEINRIERRYKK